MKLKLGIRQATNTSLWLPSVTLVLDQCACQGCVGRDGPQDMIGGTPGRHGIKSVFGGYFCRVSHALEMAKSATCLKKNSP